METGTPSSAPEVPQTRGRQRFSDLTKERDAAKAETVTERTKREGLEREVTELRARVQQAATPQQAAQAQQQLTQAEHRQAAQPAQGFQFPTYETAIEQYPTLTYTEWDNARLEAFSQWHSAQLNVDERVQRALQADRSTRSLLDVKERAIAKGRDAYTDFDAVWASGPGAGIIQHPDQVLAIINHPQSEHLQYAILRDGNLARRLAAMSPIEFGMTLAQLAPQPQAARPAYGAPPAPYTPVGSGSSTQPVPLSELTKKGFDFDKSGYREKRAAERGLKSRSR